MSPDHKIKAPKKENCLKLFDKYNLTFTFHNVNEEEINQIIDKVAPKSRFGFDGLSLKLVKTVKYVLIKH